ncbi:MAG: alpha/beta hydrolase fold domain-containing protein [Flavobacteriales bacterium]|nr:alpha/beta hydrolase fold domain-containing protein [Flavobacteriales bacterium]
MKSYISLIVFAFWMFPLKSQNLITKSYTLQTVEKDLVYGVAINYLGQADTLKLDLYKPAGYTSASRPLLVLNHGGAWIAGDKNDAGIRNLAVEFAQRGYVVASVNYRLGIHSANWASNPCPKNINATYHAIYIADSAEVYRAYYRAIQDIRGAIRFLKNRSQTDSTCPSTVFVGGESAGGFNALGVALLNDPSKKPVSCFSLPDVPMPQSNLLDNYPGANVNSSQLKRPDLGSIQGSLHIGKYDASVAGVLNFFGGLPSEGITNNWAVGSDSLLLYSTHQSCDGIVACNASPPFYPLSLHCNLGYTLFHQRWPMAHGSCDLENRIKQNQLRFKASKTEVFNCSGISIPLSDCVRFAQNGSYHYTVSPSVRCDSISRFVSSLAQRSLTDCRLSSVASLSLSPEPRIYPNPGKGCFYLQNLPSGERFGLWVYSSLGIPVPFEVTEDHQILFPQMQAGDVYFIRLKTARGLYHFKVLKEGLF